MNLLTHFRAIAIAALAVAASAGAIADTDLQFRSFRMKWADGFVPRAGATDSTQPTFLNEQSKEVLAVVVHSPPAHWSEDQIAAQHQRWISGGTKNLAVARSGFRLLGSVQQEALPSGDVLLSAASEAIDGDPQFVQQFLLVSRSARAVHFVVGGLGSATDAYRRFRRYFESVVWE